MSMSEPLTLASGEQLKWEEKLTASELITKPAVCCIKFMLYPVDILSRIANSKPCRELPDGLNKAVGYQKAIRNRWPKQSCGLPYCLNKAMG